MVNLIEKPEYLNEQRIYMQAFSFFFPIYTENKISL